MWTSIRRMCRVLRRAGEHQAADELTALWVRSFPDAPERYPDLVVGRDRTADVDEGMGRLETDDLLELTVELIGKAVPAPAASSVDPSEDLAEEGGERVELE